MTQVSSHHKLLLSMTKQCRRLLLDILGMVDGMMDNCITYYPQAALEALLEHNACGGYM